MSQLNNLESQQNDPSFANIWQELKWRGLVHVSTDEAELEKLLAGEPVTYYCGFDPTAPSLHLGNLVQLLLMRRIQLAGHKPLGLVGGSTGLIGDPRPTAERTLNTKDTVSEWVGYLQAQVRRFLSFEGDNAARMVNNLDWTAPLSAIDFLREIGKHFRVGTMLARTPSRPAWAPTRASATRSSATRSCRAWTTSSSSATTAACCRPAARTSGATSPAAPNSSARWRASTSTPWARRSSPTPTAPSSARARATRSGWIRRCAARTPSTSSGSTRRTPTSSARLKVFTFLTRAEIEALEVSVAERPFAREGQRKLAYEVTSLVHGVDATEKVIAASAALFGNGDLTVLDEATLKAATSELPSASVDAGALGIVELLVASGLSESKSAARRTVGEGGAYVNNAKVSDPETVIAPAQLLHGRYLLLRRGKKNLATVEVSQP